MLMKRSILGDMIDYVDIKAKFHQINIKISNKLTLVIQTKEMSSFSGN